VSPAILRELFARVDDGRKEPAPEPPPLDIDVSSPPPVVAPEQRALDLVNARWREIEALGANIGRTKDELVRSGVMRGWKSVVDAIAQLLSSADEGHFSPEGRA
jgi:hypothetical protein